MFNDRQKRDLERLTGRRRDTGKRAVLWDELDGLAEKIAVKLAGSRFGGALSPFITAGDIDEAALDARLPNTTTVQAINQDIDSTTTYIDNLVDGYTGTLDDIDSAIFNEQQARINADQTIASDLSTLTSNYNATSATVTENSTALTTLEGFAAATYTLRVDAGDASGSLELVAADDPVNGPRSAFRMSADNILLDGTVTAAKINVAQLSAISATIGYFKSAASGERVEIQDDRISVFDNNGTLRIRIGRLY